VSALSPIPTNTEHRLALTERLRTLREQSTALQVDLVALFERLALLAEERQSLQSEERLLDENGASHDVKAIIRQQERLLLQESGAVGHEIVRLVQERRRVQDERMTVLEEYQRLLEVWQTWGTLPTSRDLRSDQAGGMGTTEPSPADGPIALIDRADPGGDGHTKRQH
jgi:hypothetical protein